MLQLVRYLNLAAEERLAAAWHGWWALDPESGAFLSRAGGRTKAGGRVRWVLIVPNQTPAERGGLFAGYDWDFPAGCRFIFAPTEDQATEAANRKLPRMLQHLGKAEKS